MPPINLDELYQALQGRGGMHFQAFVGEHPGVSETDSWVALRALAFETLRGCNWLPVVLRRGDTRRLVRDELDLPVPPGFRAWDVSEFGSWTAERFLCIMCKKPIWMSLLDLVRGRCPRPIPGTLPPDVVQALPLPPWWPMQMPVGLCNTCGNTQCRTCGRVVSRTKAQPRRMAALLAHELCEVCATTRSLAAVAPDKPDKSTLQRLAFARWSGRPL